MTIEVPELSASTVYCVKDDVVGPNSDFTIPAGLSDGEISILITAATAKLDALLRDHFAPVTKSIILSGHGKSYLSLRQKTSLRAIAITEVRFRETFAQTDNFSSAGTVLDDTEYMLTPSRSALRRLSGSGSYRLPDSDGCASWACGPENYKVTGTFGWVNVPGPIRDACVLLTREAITPGYISKNIEPKVSERFQDGYGYTRRSAISGAQTSKPALTGWEIVDTLILPFLNITPMMIGSV